METATAHISRRCRPFIASAVSIILGSAISAAAPMGTRAAAEPLMSKWKDSYIRSNLVDPTLTKRIRIEYRAHNGARRAAFVLVPRSYEPGRPIPLVISPHGRGVSAKDNAGRWGNLPAIGQFAVVSPGGQGEHLRLFSWGAPGQIEDLARMPDVVSRALPWLEIDRDRIYAFGGSMGGQETLLLAAKHPELLAGAAAIDSLVDFPLQYRNFPRVACKAACRSAWSGPIGLSLQKFAAVEVGGTPRTAPAAYEARSPLTFAKQLAASCVPLQIWWSRKDRTVVDSWKQSGRLFREIRATNEKAPVLGLVGYWHHAGPFRAARYLPYALARFGLMPPEFDHKPARPTLIPAPTDACSR